MPRLPRAALLPLQLALLVGAGAPEASVSAPRSLVWGPGLRPGVVLPVRYFYLQAVDSEGLNFTRSPPGSVEPPASARPGPRRLRGVLSPPAPGRPSRGSGRLPWRPRLPGRSGRASQGEVH